MRCDECENADICIDHRDLKTLQGCTNGIPDRKIPTNADRIRNMSDEELAEWLTNICEIERHGEPYKSIYNLNTDIEEEIHDSYGDLLKWLKSQNERESKRRNKT